MSTLDPSMWREILTYVRRQHSEICRQWFEELEPLRLERGLLQVRAQNSLQKNFLIKHGQEPFNEAAQHITGALVVVRFLENGVDDRAGRNAATVRPNRSVESDQDVPRIPASRNGSLHTEEPLILSPDYTFGNFVIGPGNRLAHAACTAVADQPGRAYNPLFIHGGVGLGKTHLLQAICERMLERQPNARIGYLSCDTFVNHFLESVSHGDMHQFRHRYRHLDILVIDDIHFLTGRDRTQEEFFHTFNTLHQARKQIILSSDAAPNEIPQLEERLVSRFNWGLVARIDKPCYETRVAIVHKKAHIRGIDMPDDAVCYIATVVDSNTRELEGAITKLQSIAMLNQIPITLDLAQRALGNGTAGNGSQPSIQTIIDAVTDFFDVKLSDLQSKRRHRSITTPRQVCMYLARKRTSYSLEEIGGYFGGRDHTTVMHAVKTVNERIDTDNQFASQINQIDAKIATPSQ